VRLCLHVESSHMVQIPGMKRVKGRAPLSVVVAIIGGLALAGIMFTEDLRSITGKRTSFDRARLLKTD
jgi:hypothetical protein